MPARSFRYARNALGLVAVTVLVAVFGPALGARGTTLPTPTQLHASASSTFASPCGPSSTCGDPGLLVVQNTAFTLHVSLTDDFGAAAAFNKDTKLTLSATGPGSISPTGVTMPGGVTAADFSVSYSTFANAVTVTVSGSAKGGKTSTLAPGTTQSFNVLQTLKQDGVTLGQSFTDGSGPNDCVTVSSTNPICGILVLPHGANIGQVLLSTGSCVGIGCNTKGTVTQFIGDISGLYTRADPATLIIRCYRTVCGQGGVSKLLGVAAESQQAGALTTAPPCPAKNTIGADQLFCTDQVQNTREGADNSLIYVLFFDDFRGSI
jgi:hypothetical protein